jgi:hypothetical protein
VGVAQLLFMVFLLVVVKILVFVDTMS